VELDLGIPRGFGNFFELGISEQLLLS